MEIYVYAECTGVCNRHVTSTTRDGSTFDETTDGTTKEIYIHIHRHHNTGRFNFMTNSMDFDMALHPATRPKIDLYDQLIGELEDKGSSAISLDNIDVKLMKFSDESYSVNLDDNNENSYSKNCCFEVSKEKFYAFFNRLKGLIEWMDKEE